MWSRNTVRSRNSVTETLFLCSASVGEHTLGSWHVCLRDPQVSVSVRNFRLYIVFQLPRRNMNLHLRPHIFCLWLVIGTHILLFFPVICWSYLGTEIYVMLSIGNRLYSSPSSFIFSFLWNHFVDVILQPHWICLVPPRRKKSQYITFLTILFFKMFWSYLPTSPLGQDMTQGQFLSGV